MITGEEHPDEGQLAVDRGVTIGYFSQDVGEMSGRSAVSEVMDGAGPVSAVASPAGPPPATRRSIISGLPGQSSRHRSACVAVQR